MDQYEFARTALLLPGLIIVGGFAIVVAAIVRRGKIAELHHLERMAMIERGIVPPEPAWRPHGAERSHGFKMSLGIMLCGLGLAFVMLLTFAADEPGIGIGVGGAFAMVGLALITSAFFTKNGPDRRAFERPRAGVGPGIDPPPAPPPHVDIP